MFWWKSVGWGEFVLLSVPISWSRLYFCPSLPVKRRIFPYITSFPNLGQHWAARELSSPYKALSFFLLPETFWGCCSVVNRERQGRPKTLVITVFMMKNFTWKFRSDKFPSYPSKQLSFFKWWLQWWKWLYFAWLWIEWCLFYDLDLCVALSAIIEEIEGI